MQDMMKINIMMKILLFMVSFCILSDISILTAIWWHAMMKAKFIC